MASGKRLSFSVNPQWWQYVSLATLALAVTLGAVRYSILDLPDPLHCNALLTEGRWLDGEYRNWQPDGCMMHMYKPTDVETCIGPSSVVFVGDSVTRQLFFQFAHIADPTLPMAPPNDEQKHTDYSYTSQAGTRLYFHWDPFLNSSYMQSLMASSLIRPNNSNIKADYPALIVLGSGLWYLRYPESGGLPAWESRMEFVLNSLTRPPRLPADVIAVLPVEDVVSSKLSKERAASMHASDIDAMNSDLQHRIRPPSLDDPYGFFAPSTNSSAETALSLPLVFNKMLESSQTEDGLHFSDRVVNVQANILLNLRCNNVLPKKFPIDKTCCRAYPRPSPLQALVLGAIVLIGPGLWIYTRRGGIRASGFPLLREEEIPLLVISGIAAMTFVADRSGFWLKEQKQFNPWIFAFLSIVSLAAGLLTVKQSDKDLGFLNREQTDEWKGWMQVAILIYHYLGASKISGIYNPIRVLVAAYLFMTGYGHTTYYIKKANFSFSRVAQIMVRLNLLTVLLVYIMNTDYLSYYFSPLVSMWFLIIYGTMAVFSQYNDKTSILVAKILASMALMTWFMNKPVFLETLFSFLEQIFNIHWDAREWSFRVTLDLWIVYFGMFAALAVIKVRDYRLTDHPLWPLVVKGSAGASGIIFLWYFAFELYQPDKFVYNRWHPYISFLPIGAFVVLRNANGILRSASSTAFAFIGRCSLETFILQYHIWLAADTKGLLMVIPATRLRSLNFIITTIMFIYVSHHVAQATGTITSWICATAPPPSLPTAADRHASGTRVQNDETQATDEPGVQEIIFRAPEGDEHGKGLESFVLEPDTPGRRPNRWLDRLAESSSRKQASTVFKIWYGETELQIGPKAKIAIAVGVMWLLNLLWPKP